MRKLLIFLLIVFCHMQHVCGQSLHIDSTRFITGNSCCTEIRHAIPTADKGILFTGIAVGNPGGIIPLTTYGGYNVLVGKIDSNQQISWIKVYGGNDDDPGVSVCQTPDGGYAVLAATGSNDGDVTGFKGAVDIWLLRLDGAGNLLWQKTYGSSQSDGAISIANTPDNGFILLGITNGSDGDVPFHYGDFFSMDWLVIKTDGAGNVEWSKNIGTSHNEGGSGTILSVDSGYYFIAGAESKDHDCVDTAWHSGVNTGADIYLFRLDASGNILWNKSYGGSDGEDVSCAMYDERDSTIVINGFTRSNDYMVTGYQGAGDMWVVKVSKNGTLIWQRTLGSVSDDESTGLCKGPDSGYISFGWTYPGTGGGDCWIFLLDNNGNKLADKSIGGGGYDVSSSFVPYLNGFVATGNSTSVVFTEGTSYGNFSNGGAFISYIGYSMLDIPNTSYTTAPGISAYPNPVQDKISVKIKDNGKGGLVIINSIGQVIYTQQVKHGASTVIIDASVWASGLYCIRWQGESGAEAMMTIVKQ